MTQLWEPCPICGREPVYMEYGDICERCHKKKEKYHAPEEQMDQFDLQGTIYNDEPRSQN